MLPVRSGGAFCPSLRPSNWPSLSAVSKVVVLQQTPSVKRFAWPLRAYSASSAPKSNKSLRTPALITNPSKDVFSIHGTLRHRSSEAAQLAELGEEQPTVSQGEGTNLQSSDVSRMRQSPETLFKAALHDGDVVSAKRLLSELEKTERQPIAIHNSYLAECLSQFTGEPKGDTNMEYTVDRVQMDAYFFRHFRMIYIRGTIPDGLTYALLAKAFVRNGDISYAIMALKEAEEHHKISRKHVLEHLDDATIAAIRKEEEKPELPLPMTVQSKALLLLKEIGVNSHSRRTRIVDVISGSLLMKLQEENERRATEEIMERFKSISEGRKYNTNFSSAPTKNTSELRRVMLSWHKELTTEIETLLKKDGQTVPFNMIAGHPADKLSLITILEVVQLVSKRTRKENVESEIKFQEACMAVADRIEKETISIVIGANKLNRRRQQELTSKSMANKPITLEDRTKMREAAEEMNLAQYKMNPVTKAKAGALLVTKLLEVANIRVTATNMDRNLDKIWDDDTGANDSAKKTEPLAQESAGGAVNVQGDLKDHIMLPAFTHSYKNYKTRTLGVITLHPRFIEMLVSEPLLLLSKARHFPMVVPPQPWVSYNHGGYLQSSIPVLRVRYGHEQKKLVKQACSSGQLEYVFQGLDILGKTPWRISNPILEVALKVWNDGKAFGDIPAYRTIEDMKALLPPKPSSTLKADQRAWQQQCQQIRQDFRNDYSRRCSTNYQMEIAREFLDKKIYFPHNLDFRGRAYPIPSHLHHLGNDFCRGFLLFAEARPLGATGLRWLKIHMANLYGNNKVSNDERLKWTEDHLTEIALSAKDPLGEGTWWQSSEKPWQTLAGCIELTNALESKDPISYLSSLPIHQDGTCNGLQHYAALGGDHIGAEAVNLTPGDVPADVYSGVAKLVEVSVSDDINSTDPKIRNMAEMMQGNISRKLVKQTVMTSVYGVTFIGARDQISARLKEIPTLQNLTFAEHTQLAIYLATKTISSLGVMFNGARQIQNWLAHCAQLISRCVPSDFRFGDNKPQMPSDDAQPMNGVTWTTPLGLPIVQPYKEYSVTMVKTKLQCIAIVDPDTPACVSSARQKNAFPPNFVHSLDATHMLMTARGCYDEDITFASVHDSYWTHACDVDRMSSVLREQFIQLHSMDILGNLLDEFNARYKGYLIPSRFTRANLDVDDRLTEMASTNPIKQSSIVESSREGDVFADDTAEVLEELIRVDEKVADDAQNVIKQKRRTRTKVNDVYVELKFPPLPKKGDFDVTNVRDSTYFFH